MVGLPLDYPSSQQWAKRQPIGRLKATKRSEGHGRILADKKKSFEIFRTTYHSNQAVEENKVCFANDIRRRNVENVSTMRGNINKIKKRIEQLRLEQQHYQNEEDAETLRDYWVEQTWKVWMDRSKVVLRNFNRFAGTKVWNWTNTKATRASTYSHAIRFWVIAFCR